MTTSRQAYIDAPSPIQADLLAVFTRAATLVIFDVGSCEGEDSIRYARLFPNATVYAVEPLPTNLRLMRANLERYPSPGVRMVERAFSDTEGRAEFFVSSGQPPDAPSTADWDYGNKSSSLLRPDQHLVVHPWVKFDEVTEIETTTLGGFCGVEGILDIDLLHIDVQGAELKVLTGAGAMLNRTKLIWLEVERIPLYREQPLAGDVERFMNIQGFEKARERVGSVSGDQLYWNSALLGRYPLNKRVQERMAASLRQLKSRRKAR